MNVKFRLLLIALTTALLIAGCGDDDKKTETPAQPATATGTTNASGQATMNIGSYTVEATVHDTADAGLQNIGLNAYLLHNNILVLANDPDETYFPSVNVTGLTMLAKPDAPGHVQAPEETAEATVQLTIVMQPVQLAIDTIQSDPANFDAIAGDEWTTEQSHNGTLNAIFQALDTNTVFDHGAIIHLSQAVATAADSPVRTAALAMPDPPNALTFPAFAALCGFAFNVFEGDNFGYNLLSYSGTLLPIINIETITINRDFWGQFTLIWGEDPSDLDSHLWTPIIEGDSFHIYYPSDNMGDSTAAPYALLDVDDVTSFGPEHMTIYQNFPGTYVYAVHHFSGSGTIASSGATVNFLKPDGATQTFTAPAAVPDLAEDWFWHVCEVNGETGAVTTINVYSPDPPRPYVLTNAPPKLHEINAK